MSRALPALVCLLLVVTAGCAGLLGAGGAPDDDRVGYENGYWYDSELNVTTADGLNGSEREAVVARTMARVEVIRDVEFTERVPVRVVTREQYRANRSDATLEPAEAAWREQVWEAPLLVGEDRTVDEAFDAVYGSSVAGYYSPSRDEIVLVSDTETPTVDTRTLAHELVHAIQDRQLSFGGGATRDAGLAVRGLTEGDANLVEALYDERCASEWDCLAPPESGGGGAADFDFGVFLAVYAPYAEGPAFVESLRERGGWDAVNDAYDRFPESTEQVIHPERYPDDAPVEVRVRDRSDGEWDRFDRERVGDTLGEATIYAMLWSGGATDGADPYDYADPASAGWAGDTVVPYTDGGAGGYVWRVAFDTEADAREFADAYRSVLRGYGAERVAAGTYRIDSGGFADAFRVVHDGDTVTIVNGPTVADLDGIHG
ncbi:Hvo_1808 family surface protein [Halosegnis marinus]|uniref:Hvo_1808 family surface protein n=1 Tax=Halosegnis marinus TaxID=3034023 RepID=A0ABD5ZN81_9EURY|nr:Hvo_1808 family surface protein [Halosegnis sp. DT85]